MRLPGDRSYISIWMTGGMLLRVWVSLLAIIPPVLSNMSKASGPWVMRAVTSGSSSMTMGQPILVIFMGDTWKPRTQWESAYLWMPVEIGDGKLFPPELKDWSIDVRTGQVSFQ